ncbi:hypothetical protein MKZ38_006274 [Zalerion maritima]|uniref:Uncharacterized protein n=1 Tax=Zalerion maritima TaxID=339359 RepID=A0AAD5RJP4_9PEZI|nr:hypothetical protein MKZ38_006274 [Zalerion maritima]
MASTISGSGSGTGTVIMTYLSTLVGWQVFPPSQSPDIIIARAPEDRLAQSVRDEERGFADCIARIISTAEISHRQLPPNPSTPAWRVGRTKSPKEEPAAAWNSVLCVLASLASRGMPGSHATFASPRPTDATTPHFTIIIRHPRSFFSALKSLAMVLV